MWSQSLNKIGWSSLIFFSPAKQVITGPALTSSKSTASIWASGKYSRITSSIWNSAICCFSTTNVISARSTYFSIDFVAQYKNGLPLISINGFGITNPFLKKRDPAPPIGIIKCNFFINTSPQTSTLLLYCLLPHNLFNYWWLLCSDTPPGNAVYSSLYCFLSIISSHYNRHFILFHLIFLSAQARSSAVPLIVASASQLLRCR